MTPTTRDAAHDSALNGTSYPRGWSTAASRHAAFTLLELLVVVAIIAILIAIILPAIHYARIAAQSTNCKNNLRQIGVAMASYEAGHGVYPLGRLSRYPKISDFFKDALAFKIVSPRTATPELPWTVALLPYLQYERQYADIDTNVGAFGYVTLKPPYLIAGFNANHTVATARISTFLCPSDRELPYTVRPYLTFGSMAGAGGRAEFQVTRGNYAACYGNTNWNQDDLRGSGKEQSEKEKSSTRRFRDAAFGSSGRKPSQITDGLSRTIFVAEILQGEESDIRGVLWLPAPGATLYMSRLAPNSMRDLVGKSRSGDYLISGACENRTPTLPCSMTSMAVSGSSFAGARSAHRGGVHTLLGDGSVGWIDDAVDPPVWLALHTIGNQDDAH